MVLSCSVYTLTRKGQEEKECCVFSDFVAYY